MNFLTRFLSLCIILLSGYGHVLAHNHSQYDAISYSAESNVGKSQEANFDYLHTQITNYSSHHLEKLNDKSYTLDSETEENETSSKKWLEITNYFTTTFYTQVPKHFYHNIKKGLFRFKDASFLSSCKRFIVLRVIRI